MADKQYRTGLVLSGGGARGFAHLGVMQALIEENIYPDVVSGTSAGALAGALYCDGYSPKEILKIMKTGGLMNYMRPALPRYGLLQISGIVRILESHLRARTFEDLKIPLYVAATDLNHGKIVYFSKGELINRLIASSSIPVLFKPMVIDNIHYVDGGVMDNLPIAPIEKLCSHFIGSFVNPTGYAENFNSLISIAERTFILNLYKEALAKANKFDLYVAPDELSKYSILDPEKSEEIYSIGYGATKTLLALTEAKKILRPPEKADENDE